MGLRKRWIEAACALWWLSTRRIRDWDNAVARHLYVDRLLNVNLFDGGLERGLRGGWRCCCSLHSRPRLCHRFGALLAGRGGRARRDWPLNHKGGLLDDERSLCVAQMLIHHRRHRTLPRSSVRHRQRPRCQRYILPSHLDRVWGNLLQAPSLGRAGVRAGPGRVVARAAACSHVRAAVNE